MFSFFRPKWQHRNPDIRLKTIENFTDNDEKLSTIVRQDNDQRVIALALSKIVKIPVLFSLYQSEPRQQIRPLILDHLFDLLSGTHPQTESTQTRLAYLRHPSYQKLPLYQLAFLTKEQVIAENILNIVQCHPEQILQLACHPCAVQAESLMFINDIKILNDALKNITDKRSSKLIKQRIDTLKNAQHQAQLHEKLLCAFQALADTEPLPALNQLSQLENAWQQAKLPDCDHKQVAKTAYLQRHQQQQQNLLTQSALVQKISALNDSKTLIDSQTIAQLPAIIDAFTTLQQTLPNQKLKAAFESERQTLQKTYQAQQISAQKKQALAQLITQADQLLQSNIADRDACTRLLKALRNIQHHDSVQKTVLQTKINQLTQYIEQHQPPPVTHDDTQLQELLNTAHTAIENGKISTAQTALSTLKKLLRESALPTKKYQHYLNSMNKLNHQLNALQQVGSWAAEQSRLALCLEAEQLTATDDYPIELLSDRLKQLQQSWRSIQKNEAGKFAPRALWRRFEKACHKGFERLKQAKTQRFTQRQTFIDEAHVLLEQLRHFIATINWQQPQWNHLDKTRRQFLNHWQQYLAQTSQGENLPYGMPIFLKKDQQHLNQTMRTIMQPLTDALQNERKREKNRRLNDIATLKQNLTNDDLPALMQQIKRIRSQWRPTLSLYPKQEEALWSQFCHVCNDIYMRRQRENHAVADEQEHNFNAKNKLIKTIEEMINHLDQKNTSELPAMMSIVDDIEQQWNNIGSVPKEQYQSQKKQFMTVCQTLLTLSKQRLQAEQQAYLRVIQAFITSLQYLESICSTHDHFNDEQNQILAQIKQDYDQTIHHQFTPSLQTTIQQRLHFLHAFMQGQADETAYQHLKEKIAQSNLLARQYCIEKEILLQQDSPADDMHLRIAHQINRLQHIFQHQENIDSSSLLQLEQRWYTDLHGSIDPALVERFFRH